VNANLRFLLLQSRNDGDPMRQQEVRCFARTLGCELDQIEVFDLLSAAPTEAIWKRADMVLLGGSGHYSAVGDGPWLLQALESLKELRARELPTFASCWGFQALARALGGRVINDVGRAELGTIQLMLTDAGRIDPLFSELPNPFRGQAGHEDHVIELPAEAVLLASSTTVENQAYRIAGLPIYCTQFHPELNRDDLLSRVNAYPEYIEKVSGMTHEEFVRRCQDAPETSALLPKFVEMVFE